MAVRRGRTPRQGGSHRRRSIDDVDAETKSEIAGNLRERVYVTFTVLAVVLALESHAETLSPGAAAGTMVITALGTILATLTAEVVAQLAVHTTLPSRHELRRLIGGAIGALTTVVLPLIFVALAAFKVWDVELALLLARIVLIITLGFVGLLAVRRATIKAWQRLVLLVVLIMVGLVVTAVNLLAHG